MPEDSPREDPPDRDTPRNRLAFGLIAIALGVAGIVVAQRTELNFTKALTGGFYVKDPWHSALLYGGIFVAVLGGLSVLAALMSNVDEGAAELLASTSSLASVAMFVGLCIVAVSYENARDNRLSSANTPVTNTSRSNSTTPVLVVDCKLGSGGVPTSNCTDYGGSEAAQPVPGSYDQANGCTWEDDGENAAGGYEVYVCR